MTYTIRDCLVEKFEKRLAKFANKFKKYGSDAFSYEKGEPRYDDEKKEFVVDIDVVGKYKVCGYEFVATLEWDDDTNSNIIKKISSEVFVPEVYRTRNWCDHCNTNRVRKNTVLLRNEETNEYVQVGKACVVDYLGVDIENYASYISLWEDLDEIQSDIEFVSTKQCYEVEEILCETIEFVSKYGYVSSRASEENGSEKTSSRVWNAINRTTVCGEIIEPYLAITDESKEKAKEVIEFIKNCDDSGNDYVGNLKILIQKRAVYGNNFGLVVSMVGYYLREVNKNKSKSESTSEYIGNVGDKVTFTATPTCVYSYESEYGWNYIYKFLVDGNEVVWKTSKFLESEELTVKGTVKSTQVYKGHKQTEVTRCRVIA